MSAKRGFSYIELMIIMLVIAIVAMMSLATWRPPRDEYGNTIYTKDGKYVNDFRKINDKEVEYERHVDEFKGAGRIDGMNVSDLTTNAALLQSLGNFLGNTDADGNGKVDEVPVIIEVYKGDDVTNQNNLLIKTDVPKIVQDGQLFVVEYGDN